jgi:hypothetical protein
MCLELFEGYSKSISRSQIIANHRYDPFGNTISQSGAGSSSYGYTGEWSRAFAACVEARGR